MCPLCPTETAAVMRSGVGRSPSQFYTRCIKDPNLIPLLVTAGVEFGALRVRTASCLLPAGQNPFDHLLGFTRCARLADCSGHAGTIHLPDPLSI